MVADIRYEHGSEWAAIVSVGSKLGIGTAHMLHKWIRKVQVDSRQRSGVTTAAAAELHASRGQRIENLNVPTRA